ncbi:hypothetical protein WN51_12128 [Melipona quadrifasciata]|uniref:Uncharacterized protein n=1 Tax=Melipona quadrifasciata TaxID=166423 RepID=A0A0M9A3H5_9HYME|nr:hypothetical protein WN51_12128 [Melipona quadrifasciata]
MQNGSGTSKKGRKEERSHNRATSLGLSERPPRSERNGHQCSEASLFSSPSPPGCVCLDRPSWLFDMRAAREIAAAPGAFRKSLESFVFDATTVLLAGGSGGDGGGGSGGGGSSGRSGGGGGDDQVMVDVRTG